jgi:hypothetical protein
MMTKKMMAAAAFAVTAACNGAVFASDLRNSVGDEPFLTPNYIIDSNNQIAVQFVSVNFDYIETANGAPLDTEKGWVSGIGGSVSFMGNFLVPNLYLNAQFARYEGETDYVGAYWGQPFGTLRTTSDATVTDFDFRLGKGFELQRNVMLTPYFGVGSHAWDRGVNAGEEYSHGYYGGGVMLQVSPFDRFVLSGTALIGETFNSEIVIESNPGLPGSTLALGDSTIYRFGVSGDYAITKNLHVNAGVEWVDFEYGRSGLDPTGQYYEPDSETSHVIVKVGLGYAFGPAYEPLK